MPRFHVPIFENKAQADQVYILCGRIAVNWGPVELGIESVLTKLRHNVNYGTGSGTHKWSVPFPLQFGRKVDEIKLHLKSAPKFAPVRAKAVPVLSRCKTVFQVRCHVVHSICQGTNLAGKVMFGTSDQREGISYKQTDFTIKQLENAATKMLHLTTEINEIFQDLSSRALR